MNQIQAAAQILNLRQKESVTWTSNGMKKSGKTG